MIPKVEHLEGILGISEVKTLFNVLDEATKKIKNDEVEMHNRCEQVRLREKRTRYESDDPEVVQ